MAVINFKIADFEKEGIIYLELKSAIDSLGMEVSPIKDGAVDVEVTPNRPDLLDFYGLVRAVKHKLGKRAPKENFYRTKQKPSIEIFVKGNVNGIRPFIAGMEIRNADLSGNRLKYLINFTEKIAETYGRKRKKLALGIHNLDNMESSLTYDASSTGKIIPLNDKKERTFGEIMARHQKSVEYGKAVSNEAGKIPFLSDSRKVISLIPIINSEATKVTNSAKNLFIDITGTSIDAVTKTADMMACSFIDQGCNVVPATVHYKKKDSITPSLTYNELKIRAYKINETIGSSIEDSRLIGIAECMGYTGSRYGNSVIVSVPPYRADVINEQDVIEDIAIGYGYNKIKPAPIPTKTRGSAYYITELINSISVNMIGLGFTEAMNNILTNKETNFQNMRIEKSMDNETITLNYSKTNLLTMLRTSLIPGLLQNLSISASESMPQRLFEIGGIFKAAKNSFREDVNLAFVSEHSKAEFSEVKADMEALLRKLGYRQPNEKSQANKTYTLKASVNPSFIDGRYAEILSEGTLIGTFGEVHPSVLKNFKLEEPVVAAEIILFKDIDY
jgi:phenylalanyl-tRNA synthetase beta chain